MNFLAIIPARGGSKGVPRKNIRLLGGIPLIAHTIIAARDSRYVSRLVVSTEDSEIASVAREWGAEIIERPMALAADDTPTLPVLQHSLVTLESQGFRPDAVITLQATSPLRQSRHINAAVEMFVADSRADSLVSCVPVPHIFHPSSVMEINDDGYLHPFLSSSGPLRRQEKSSLVARNGAAIYITRTERLNEFIFGGNLLAYQMDSDSSIDIDDQADLLLAEQMLLRELPTAENK